LATSSNGYWIGGLASQFLTIAVALASFDFIQRRRGKYFVPVLLLQSLLLVPIGSRWSVVAGAVLVIWALTRAGISPAGGQVLLVSAAALLGAFTLSAARVADNDIENAVGRFGPTTQVGPISRAKDLLGGVEGLSSSWNNPGLWADWVYRFDGNTFPAVVSREIRERGAKPAGPGRLLETGVIAVPSFLYKGKANLNITERNEETYMQAHYNLSRHEDFLPTTLGMLYAYGGVAGLWAAAALLGLGFALLDRWLTARLTPARLLIGLGVLLCALLYEQGVEVYPLTLRGVVALVVIVKLLEFGRALVHGQTFWPRIARRRYAAPTVVSGVE
jgi:hypothetical protein